MDKGIYTLIFRNRACTLGAGALGEVRFRGGWHIYVGSALGPGGLARARRHLHLARVRDRPPRWHVDYLLLSPAFTLRYLVCAATDRNMECALAVSLGARSVPGFGSSDCPCGSHLFYRPRDPRREVEGIMVSLGLTPGSTILIKG